MTGHELVEKITKWIRAFAFISEDQALVAALWALNTWVYDKFASTPYLEICASTKRSGKTTLMDTILLLCRNPKSLATVRPLTFVKMIEAYAGAITFGFDEAERLASPTLGDTRSMLAVGYRAGALHAVGSGKQFMEYPTYCPKVFALIGNLTGILRDRCIPIDLQRGRPARDLQAENEVAKQEAEEIVNDWKTLAATIHRLPVVSPDWLDGREREIWTPLVSLAHALNLHKDTMDRLVAISVDLGQLKTQPPKKWHSAQDEIDADDRDAASRAIADLRLVLKDGERAIFSSVAVDRMRALPTAPWRSFRGDGLNEIMLAALLSRYGIVPKLVRMESGREGKPLRGYVGHEVKTGQPSPARVVKPRPSRRKRVTV